MIRLSHRVTSWNGYRPLEYNPPLSYREIYVGRGFSRDIQGLKKGGVSLCGSNHNFPQRVFTDASSCCSR
jgi:hypothetical protein